MYNKIIVLGGSGYIGSVLKECNSNIICLSSKDYNSEHILDNTKLLDYVNLNNVDCLIDLTRNNKRQLMSFYLLLSQLSQSITYVTLTSYSLVDNSIYGDDKDNVIDLYISKKINLYLSSHRQKFYSFITPLITDTDDVVVKDIYALKADYTYYCIKNIFAKFVFDTISTKAYGIYQVPAKKFKYA